MRVVNKETVQHTQNKQKKQNEKKKSNHIFFMVLWAFISAGLFLLAIKARTNTEFLYKANQGNIKQRKVKQNKLFHPFPEEEYNLNSKQSLKKKTQSRQLTKWTSRKRNPKEKKIPFLPEQKEGKNYLELRKSKQANHSFGKDNDEIRDGKEKSEQRHNPSFENQTLDFDRKYHPYLELGGIQYFNQQSKLAGVYDLFIPLSQQATQLFFADLRFFDRGGSSFEGNLHLGYRTLFSKTKHMFGVYGSFDRKRSAQENFFNQIILGGEYWNHNWFIGGNIYKAIGQKKKLIKKTEGKEEEGRTGSHLIKTKHITNLYEESQNGVDAECGYTFTERVTGYLGGYYFPGSEAKTIWGPKVRMTYDYRPTSGKRVFAVLDGVSLEAGIQHDTWRKISGYIEIKIKVGLTNLERTSNISGFDRHMVELVRRDPDIVTGVYRTHHIKERRELSHSQGSTVYLRENYVDWETSELLQEFGLEKEASYEEVEERFKEIRRNYRKETLRWHPDRKGGNTAKQITLNNGIEKKRKIHDELKKRFRGLRCSIQENASSQKQIMLALPASVKIQTSSQEPRMQEGTIIKSFTQEQERDRNAQLVISQKRRNLTGTVVGKDENKIDLIDLSSLRIPQANHALIGDIVRHSNFPNIIRSYEYHGGELSKKVEESRKTERVKESPEEFFNGMRKNEDCNKALQERGAVGSEEEEETQRISEAHASDNITRMDYEYSNVDIERILIYRLFELTRNQNNAIPTPLLLVFPISKETLLLSPNPQRFGLWIKKEIEDRNKKILIPVYLDNEKHWISLLFERKAEKEYVEVKYFDSLARKGPQNRIKEWLNQVLGNLYSEDIKFIDQGMQQPDSSVGCGAFTIENVIRGLDNAANEVNLEEENIRKLHARLLERYKNHDLFNLIEVLKGKEIIFTDLNNELSFYKGRMVMVGGGRKESDKEGNVDYSANSIDLQNERSESISRENDNIVYQFINDHEYLLAPLSGATAGGIRGGLWGAIIGGALGIIDETLIYFNYTDKHHLTWGAFGVATGHMINPSIVSSVTGGIAGMLLPTGIPTEVLSNHKELIAPMVSAVAEGTKSELSGVINGGMFGAMDEVLIYYDLTDKHYLTFCTLGTTVINLLGYLNGMPMLADSVGIVLGLVMASYEEEIITNWSPIAVGKDVYYMYSRILPKGLLDAHIEKQALALLSSQFVIQYFALEILGCKQGSIYHFEHLDAPGQSALSNFQSKLIRLGLFVFPFLLVETFARIINDYFSSQLCYSLEEVVYDKWLQDEVALRLSFDNETSLLIDNLKKDIFILADSGNKLISSAISKSVKGMHGLGMIINKSPDILIYSVIYNQGCLLISTFLAQQKRTYDERVKVQESKISNIIKHDSRNFKIIIERDGIGVTSRKLKDAYVLLRDYEASKNLWVVFSEAWYRTKDFADFVFNYYFVGYKIYFRQIPFESRAQVHFASRKVLQLFSWAGEHAGKMASIYQSLERINLLMGKIDLAPTHVDQIKRVISDENRLVLKNLEITIDDLTVVSVDHLVLEMGKVYALTGASGSGKTSLLSKIKGVQGSKVGGSGIIFYPFIEGKPFKIVMISQQDYFPLDSSLLEIILYPDEIPSNQNLLAEQKEKIAAFLDELGLSSIALPDQERGRKNIQEKRIDLDIKKDWYTVLSGGEKKKIMAISAVLKEPHIVLLDEIFAGMDRYSVNCTQRILKRCLNDTLILVVDHHLHDNDFDFYNAELHFSDKHVVFQPVP